MGQGLDGNVTGMEEEKLGYVSLTEMESLECPLGIWYEQVLYY